MHAINHDRPIEDETMVQVSLAPPRGLRITQISDVLRMKQDLQKLFEEDQDSAEAAFVLGLIAFRDGRHGAAADAIARAVAIDGSNPDFHYYHAGSCLALGRAEEAAAGYRRAIALNPDYAEAHHELGRLLAAQGQPDAAATSFAEALRVNSDFVEAHVDFGQARASQGRYDEAVGAFGQAVRLNPAHQVAQKGLAEASLRVGRLDEAMAAYREAIKLKPEDGDAHNDLGIILVRRGRHEEAVTSYRQAIRLKPDLADAHNNLGNALRNLNRLDEAIVSLREAIRIRPNYPEAHNNLAIVLRRKGSFDEAIQSYQTALQLRPNYAEAHNNLGFAWASRGKHDAAVACYQQAVRLKPDYVEAHNNLGNSLADSNRTADAEAAFRRAIKLSPRDARFHKSLGNVLAKLNKLDESAASYREAIKLRPDYPEAHNDLGINLARQSKFEEALPHYHEALKHRPGYAEAHNNMGNSFRNLGRFDESIAAYRQAIALKSNYADAYNNLGIALAEMARFDEAVDAYTQCLKLKPTHVDAHMNRALTWLRKGDFAQGWAEYEWRWKKRNVSNRPLIQPQWNGFPLAGRTILLVPEQGLGDTLQFVRYAPLLKAQGARVVLECPERLMKILARTPGIDQLVAQSEPMPEHDVYAPLLTLPGLMATSELSIPAGSPYVHTDPALVEHWSRELGESRELKIGINWQGNPQYAGDRHRSVPLANFAAVAKVPGVKLYSLQKNHGLDQLKPFAAEHGVVDLGGRLDEQTGPFLDTAAVLKNLDLFITSDTSVAHLAGALGVPVWMALSTTPDWRWRSDGEESSWYPSMRIFRQAEFGGWRAVFDRMASELRKLVPATLRVSAIRVRVAPGELLDKISILRIKAERIGDPIKLHHVRSELETLLASRDETIAESSELASLDAELRGVNESLWEVEDEIRVLEQSEEFGPRFIELARSVYRLNDRRAALKRRINDLLGSELVEEKSYAGG
jgi:tetratricopeptide (TPR) repeat protein